MKTTVKEIREYFNEQGYAPRHEFKGLKFAANKLSKETKLNAWDLLLLVIENQPIEGAYTHSYGFHTREGRYLIETFQSYYYEKQNC
jgi:hypothetical protein